MEMQYVNNSNNDYLYMVNGYQLRGGTGLPNNYRKRVLLDILIRTISILSSLTIPQQENFSYQSSLLMI